MMTFLAFFGFICFCGSSSTFCKYCWAFRRQYSASDSSSSGLKTPSNFVGVSPSGTKISFNGIFSSEMGKLKKKMFKLVKQNQQRRQKTQREKNSYHLFHCWRSPSMKVQQGWELSSYLNLPFWIDRVRKKSRAGCQTTRDRLPLSVDGWLIA